VDKITLSKRIRPNSEILPWIHNEIVALEDELEFLATEYDTQGQHFYRMEADIEKLQTKVYRLEEMYRRLQQNNYALLDELTDRYWAKLENADEE